MDISLERQALSASVIWFEKLSRDHQLSWRKLLKMLPSSKQDVKDEGYS